MIFQLGGIPWNKGKKRPPFSKEWIAKMKLARQGRKPFLGHHHSEKSKKKTSESMKKNGWYPPSPFGRKHSEETRIKIGFSQQGNKSHRWKGGKTNKNCLIRNSVLYKLWREKVFERDKFTCQNCKKIGGKLNADHIKPFAFFPKLRFELSNGRTLCFECHKETPTFGKNVLLTKNNFMAEKYPSKSEARRAAIQNPPKKTAPKKGKKK